MWLIRRLQMMWDAYWLLRGMKSVCGVCGEVVDGDTAIIYRKRWYHRDCFEEEDTPCRNTK